MVINAARGPVADNAGAYAGTPPGAPCAMPPSTAGKGSREYRATCSRVPTSPHPTLPDRLHEKWKRRATAAAFNALLEHFGSERRVDLRRAPAGSRLGHSRRHHCLVRSFRRHRGRCAALPTISSACATLTASATRCPPTHQPSTTLTSQLSTYHSHEICNHHRTPSLAAEAANSAVCSPRNSALTITTRSCCSKPPARRVSTHRFLSATTSVSPQ